jgi:hypothetical protein
MKHAATCYVGICFLVAAAGATATAQTPVAAPTSASALYERGVQAYFAGRSSEAEGYLSQALASNSDDPRYYYFRALSLLRLGRSNEARGDMMLGAEVEARAGARFAVGASLERIQGAQRLILEQFRQRARDQNATHGAGLEQRDQSRVHTSGFADDSAVLRQRVLAPLPRFRGRGGFESPEPANAETSARSPRRFVPIGDQTPPRNARPVSPTMDADPFRDDALEKTDTLPDHEGVESQSASRST